jgi:YD repeat-containing protein
MTNPDGSTTEDIYDQHGNLIRQIQQILPTGTLAAGYEVTVHTYDYGTFSIEDAEYIGSSIGPNTVFDEADYQPFFVAGTDLAGVRFTQQPAQLASETNYFFSTDDDNIPLSDNGQIESQTTYTENSDGVLVPQTTSYSEYVNGKPGTITDSSGAYTVNSYDGNGNLKSTKQYASETAYLDNQTPLNATDYTYTNGVSNVPSGLPVATTRPGNGGSGSITTSSNDYFGTVSATSPSYVVALPGSADPYDSAGMLASSTDVNNVPTFYDYDELGDQILSYTPKSTDEGSSPNAWDVTVTEYDWDGRVTETETGTILNPSNATAPSFTVASNSATPGAVTFNTTANPIYNDVSQSNGGTLVATHTNYDASGRVENSTDQYGGVTSYVFDVSGNLIETINPDGTETITEYDDQNRPVLSTDPFNPSNIGTIPIMGTATKYDSAGRVIETDRVSGIGISVTGITGDVGTVSVTATGTVESTSTTTYNANGSVASTTDAEGLTTDYTYYPDGQQETVTEENVPVYGANGPQVIPTLYNYDADGRQTSVIGPTGVLESGTVYDALGRATKTIYADGSFTETLYSVEGEPVTVDGEGELILPSPTVSIPAGGSETVQIAQRKIGDPINATFDIYDKAGNLVEVYQPEVLNNAGTTEVYPETTYGYDTAGNETIQIDANEYAAYATWQAANPTLPVTQYTGVATRYAYDENGNMLTEMLPNGESESWTYNQFGQVATQTDFDQNVATYTYYTSGVNAGKIEQVVYTGSGKTTQSVNYTYDNLGRQKTIVDLTGTTTYSYDQFSNLIEVNGPEGDIHYVYNALGEHTETYTTSNDTLYSYDDLGRLDLVQVTKLNGSTVNQATTYAYDVSGNLAMESQPDDMQTTYQYNALNELTDELVVNTSTHKSVFAEHYDILDNGLRSDVIDTRYNSDTNNTIFSQTETSWSYDANGHLTDETLTVLAGGSNAPAAYHNHFAFDLDGNRIQEIIYSGNTTTVADTINYTYNSDNQLKEEKETLGTGTTVVYDTIYNYDNNGSLTSSVRTGSGAVTDTYTYDVRNRMGIATVNGVTTNYAYDDSDVRISETTGSSSTYYLNDTNNPTGYTKAIQESSTAGGTPTRSYVLGLDVDGQSDSTNGTLYLLTDGHGSTRALVDLSGTIQEEENYDSFGNLLSSTGAQSVAANSKTPWLYGGGGLYDPGSGFTYNLDRYVDGFWWTQKDNITEIPGDLMNADLYVYVDANPVNMGDATGHDSEFYTFTNGIAAHILFSAYVLTRGFMPHLIGPDATKGKNYYELKPITHLSDGESQIDDENQMFGYDVTWGAQGYMRGNATDIVQGGIPTPIGYILGDGGIVYLMTLYVQNNPMEPSGLDGQAFVLYSLSPVIPPQGFVVPKIVPAPKQRQYQIIPPSQRYSLPISTTYDYQTLAELGAVTVLGGAAIYTYGPPVLEAIGGLIALFFTLTA